MVVALYVIPQLNEMLQTPDSDDYALVRDAAAQPGISLREAVERCTVLDRVADQNQVETMRAELDFIPQDVGRTIVDAVHEACESNRRVLIEWERIEPDAPMSAEVAQRPGADAHTHITVRTPHGDDFPH